MSVAARLAGLATLVAIASGCEREGGPAAAAPAAITAAQVAAQSAFASRRLPGMAVVILQDAATVVSHEYGYADVDRRRAVTARTVFQLGSIGKQFLAALVVALAGDGALSLDDPVTRHLSGLAHVPPTVRVRHLLTHTSGIRELFQLPGALEAFDDLSRTRQELFSTVSNAPVDVAPGSRWSYSNTNYTLLAMLVERVSQQPYDQAIVTRLLEPAGLRSLRPCRSIPDGPDDALGYVWDGTRNVAAAPENMEWIRGDGGFCGTATDLARWTQLLSTGRIIRPEQYAQMTEGARLDSGAIVEYGFGLALARPDDMRKISHGGAMRGYSAQAAYYPERATTVVVLTNRGDVRADAIERAITRAVLERPRPARAAVPLPPEARAAFVGEYDIGVFTIRVSARGDVFWLEAPPPGPTMPLRYVGNGVFVSDAEPDGVSIEFASERKSVRLYMGAMHWYGIRVE
jgi:D-alanyl-D-alanine carboxypeptidase